MKPSQHLFMGFLAFVLIFEAKAAEIRATVRNTAIWVASKSAPAEALAAKEVRRYVYATTGSMLPIQTNSAPLRGRPNLLVVGRMDQEPVRSLAAAAGSNVHLGPQDFWLRTLQEPRRRVLLLTGGSDTAVLYAAYRYAEHLGVRFYLHGDVLPDPVSRRALFPKEGLLPDLDETSKPLFPLRGIQPFHDFPEGPDWWDRDDYFAILAQLPKMRLNFFGLHTYPEGNPNAEPTVWIGRAADIREDGQVAAAYPASYQNTRRGNWGYAAKPTSQFPFGAAALFDREDFGNDAMRDLAPEPVQPEANRELFRRSGKILGDVFQAARELGIKTCLGTETPLTIPKAMREHLQAQGLNPTNAETVRLLYEGMFQRLGQIGAPDYYWFWTPETWTWEGVKEGQVKATMDDLRLAEEAAKNVKAKFQLATCGWVLGPPDDRSLFDQTLPKSWPVSCINREVGKTPIEPGFAQVSGRPKWAIPWLEDDPALTAPQLWVGRMRQDAVDALQYGCDGIMGIHWRTRVLGPAASALAQAAWEQDSWKCDTSHASGWIGGKDAAFPTNKIKCEDHEAIYQTVRYGMSHCRIGVPDGVYQVRLRFWEPNYDAKGKRVFSVKLQGRLVVDHLDIFAQVGKDCALDRVFEGVVVGQGRLNFEFISHTDHASLAGIEISGPVTRKINCGGPACGDFEADLPSVPRYQPVADFYLDWARTEFGPDAAEAIAEVFTSVDGKLPCPAEWVDGPGNLACDSRPWADVAKDYAFVDRLVKLEPRVKGRVNRERFAYWRHTFEYQRAMARLSCTWGQLRPVVEKIEAEKDAAWKTKLAQAFALPLRREFARQLGEVYNHLLALVSNPGELGTVANWGQHIPVKTLERTDALLAKCLGASFQAEAPLPLEYTGPDRLIIPTARTTLRPGEDFKLKAILLSAHPATGATFHWRPLGKRTWQKAPFKLVARAVWQVELPAKQIAGSDFEYRVEGRFKGRKLNWASLINNETQTVIKSK